MFKFKQNNHCEVLVSCSGRKLNKGSLPNKKTGYLMTPIKSTFTPTLPGLLVTRTIMTNCWRQKHPVPRWNNDKFQQNLVIFGSALKRFIDHRKGKSACCEALNCTTERLICIRDSHKGGLKWIIRYTKVKTINSLFRTKGYLILRYAFWTLRKDF